MTADRPNVLLLFTDQQHADMMGCAGNPHLDTPAMDGIAESGVLFPSAFCANPVCSPSRTALLTGRFPSSIGQRSNADQIDPVPDEVAEGGLGHRLRDAGYDVALEESGLREETVVIFCSDHGDMDAAHRPEHKTALYDEAMRVPFVIDDPRGRNGAVDERLVSLLDVLPTACDYANGDLPAGPERSVRPLVRGDHPDWRSQVRVESQLGEAIVTDRFRYVLYDEGANREQLYDHRVDPGETRNHAPDHPDVVAELRSQLMNGSRLQ